MNKILCYALLGMLFTLSASAKTVMESRQTSGYGSSYQEALAAALLEAVRQVRGLEIGTEKQLQMEFQQIATGSSETTTAKAGVKEDIYTRSKGWVDSYEVVEVIKPQAGKSSWEVIVLANIPKFQSDIKNDTRKSIAIMPFRFATATFAVNDQGKTTNAYQLSRRLKDRIQSEFTQSRKFSVLNRDYGEEFESETKLLSSKNVPASEAGRLGQVLGADFMVVGNIFDLSTKVERSTFYGMTETKMVDRIDLSYQVIEVATQKVMWADTVSEEFPRKKGQKNTVTLDAVASIVVSGVMDVIYPVKVMDVASKTEIYLNQGGDRVKVGDRFELFTKGRKITDPDTGMPIKVDGSRLGELSVLSVLPKYAIAELVDGEIKQVQKGAVVRLKAREGRSAPVSKEVRPTAGSSEAPIQW
ncbi:CsgG/HfaB family protein [Alkalimarinus sediminis]|uniref:CsgG/HfaB family protein n=1 Tax=Alkalimarinus sediminis TaxID=1632866 RepID=A0A9E8HGF4_9ALTE|nr:CsgG/HfaB family protein [Alkalimarinus sediminis]UZW73959.1 CsgG/HfaB family protein [Alkalimarinus sediminis]